MVQGVDFVKGLPGGIETDSEVSFLGAATALMERELTRCWFAFFHWILLRCSRVVRN